VGLWGDLCRLHDSGDLQSSPSLSRGDRDLKRKPHHAAKLDLPLGQAPSFWPQLRRASRDIATDACPARTDCDRCDSRTRRHAGACAQDATAAGSRGAALQAASEPSMRERSPVTKMARATFRGPPMRSSAWRRQQHGTSPARRPQLLAHGGARTTTSATTEFPAIFPNDLVPTPGPRMEGLGLARFITDTEKRGRRRSSWHCVELSRPTFAVVIHS